VARYHGKNAQFYLQGSGGVAVPSVGFAEFSIDMSTDRSDATGFENSNVVETQGLPKFSGAFSGWWDDTFDVPFEAQEASAPRSFYAYPSILAGIVGNYWYGTCWVDTSLAVSVKDTIKLSGTWSAATNITRKT
jgi:hypothetical protein